MELYTANHSDPMHLWVVMGRTVFAIELRTGKSEASVCSIEELRDGTASGEFRRIL